MSSAEPPIWTPDPAGVETSRLAAFTRHVQARYDLRFADYQALWQWSVDRPAEFWGEVWDFFDVTASSAPTASLASRDMPGASWFPSARVNYVDQVFRDRPAGDVAVVAVTEDGGHTEVSWGQLEQRVAALARTLVAQGVRRGDRVVGYLPNCAATVVAFLATASLGAIWSCCGQDYAAPAAANRLSQLGPKVLIAADGYHFGGRTHDRRAETAALMGLLPALEAVILVSHLGLEPPPSGAATLDWEKATSGAAELTPEQVPFDHPLWVLFSSGTTGVPKGLVHGHGGVIIEYLKSMGLHLDIGAGDRLLWYTTTNWMMWNFTVSALLAGVTIIAYDGSPAHPQPDQLWRICGEHQATVLGTSPGYLLASERAGLRPAVDFDLERLRLIGATGAPLPPGAAYWVRDQFDSRLPLVSTSGGTDVVTALAYWAPSVPIWAGEMSCAPLGVAVDSFDAGGRPVRGDVGELVVTAPMPTMPVTLWNDPDGSRLRATYFDVYPGIWRHGDWVTITDRNTFVIHGRSDATLNRNGVRMGSADIYDIVERMPEVREALVVGVDLAAGRYWMPLFVVLADDAVLDDALRSSICDRLRREASPRHVPDEIIEVAAIPHTRTGKKLEVPIKRILLGARAQDVLSLDAVDEPRALDVFAELAARRRETIR